VRGDVVFEKGRAEGGADAGGFEEVLVATGRPCRGRAFRRAPASRRRGLRLRGLVGDQGDDGVDLRIDAIDLLEVLLQRFAR